MVVVSWKHYYSTKQFITKHTISLYNRVRQHNDEPDSLCGGQSMSIKAVVLAELALYM